MENLALCRACGGQCCLNMPGIVHPENIPSANTLRQMLASGRYTIDCWEGDPRQNHDELQQCFYVRPAIKGKEGWITDYAWNGACTFLTAATGCELPYNGRPHQCRKLEPADNPTRCTGALTKRDYVIAWLPFQELLDTLSR